jgi:hypothetical protein
MGLLRPARRVTSPSGDEWEIYVSKTKLPAWRGSDADDAFDLSGYGSAQFDVLELPIMVIAFVWANILVPLTRMLVLMPLAVVRGHRSRAVRVEAVTTFPHRQVVLWTTTDVHVARVVDEVAAGLAAGTFAKPEGAFFHGPDAS